ncbi:MAG: hypothetical protein EXR85_08380 [Xanthomonadales bacterium]|nr:hypothetical protein [Xanthomonadales bacterium]
MYHDSSLLAATGLYILAATLLYVSIRNQSRAWWLASVAVCFLGATVHGFNQYQHWMGSAATEVGILNLLSLCALVIVLMLCTSVFSSDPLYDASIIALPLTIVVLALEWSVPSNGLLPESFSAGASFHILSSVLAFGVLSIAGVYALFVAIIDHFLRRHHLNPLVKSLPPLETLERLLFRLIAMGFILLTFSLGTGLAFVDDLFAQHLAHKTILSIMAWLIFGLLLWGRWQYGWRGRQAVRLTLAGILLLLLAYFGSKLVLETILGRSWRN